MKDKSLQIRVLASVTIIKDAKTFVVETHGSNTVYIDRSTSSVCVSTRKGTFVLPASNIRQIRYK